jgi:hypothetical protein
MFVSQLLIEVVVFLSLSWLITGLVTKIGYNRSTLDFPKYNYLPIYRRYVVNIRIENAL